MKQYKEKWISINSIEELYENASKNSLEQRAYHAKRAGEDISSWLKSEPRGGRMVNVGYLEYIWERRRKIQFRGQEMYYELCDKISETKLIKEFEKYCKINGNSVYHFFKVTLFRNTYDISITDFHISKRVIQFYNFCLEKLEAISFDSVSEEYDYYEAKRIMRKTK